jgi:hypothetical protein
MGCRAPEPTTGCFDTGFDRGAFGAPLDPIDQGAFEPLGTLPLPRGQLPGSWKPTKRARPGPDTLDAENNGPNLRIAAKPKLTAA